MPALRNKPHLRHRTRFVHHRNILRKKHYLRGISRHRFQPDQNRDRTPRHDTLPLTGETRVFTHNHRKTSYRLREEPNRRNLADREVKTNSPPPTCLFLRAGCDVLLKQKPR